MEGVPDGGRRWWRTEWLAFVFVSFRFVADTPIISVCQWVCLCRLVLLFLAFLLASRSGHGRWQAAGRPKAMSEGCVTKEGGGCERPSSAGGSERGLGASLWGPSCWLAMEARPLLPSAITLPLSSLSLSLSLSHSQVTNLNLPFPSFPLVNVSVLSIPKLTNL